MNIYSISSNDFYELIDKNSNSIICAGNIIGNKLTGGENGKYSCKYISFDNKYFFNVDNNSKFVAIKKQTKTTIINFNDKLLKKYSFDYWRYADIHFNNNDIIDIYIENTKLELDVEVIQLCNAINSIPGVETVGSCSGHNRTFLYVDIKFLTLSSLKTFMIILGNDIFRHEFIFEYSPNIIISKYTQPTFKLHTKTIGKNAYILADKLAAYITTIF